MKVLRTDLVSMFDLETAEDAQSADVVRRLKTTHQALPMADLLDQSAEWVFGADTNATNGLVRVVLPVRYQAPHAKAATVLFDPIHRLGVLSVWHSFGPEHDPLDLKRTFWADADDVLDEFTGYGFDIAKTERLYPFLAVRLDTADVESTTKRQAVDIGRLFTGDFESEEEHYLAGYIEANLSHRKFERLLVRWTDALAVYGRDGDVNERMVLPMLRAAQIYERCILLERSLKKIGASLDGAYGELSPFRPWTMLAVGRIQKELSSLEERYFLSPSVVSIEAQRLLTAAYGAFGVSDLLVTAKQRYQLLDGRFQWTKTQLLVLIGVLSWFADTIAKL